MISQFDFWNFQISENDYFSAEKDTAGVGTGMEKVEEGNTDHPPGLSLNGDQKTKKDTSRGFQTMCYRCSKCIPTCMFYAVSQI